jgi:hypothetical protein
MKDCIIYSLHQTKEDEMGWLVPRMREMKTLCRILWATLEGRVELGDLDVDGSMLLKLILKEWCVGVWSEFILLRIGSSGRML